MEREKITQEIYKGLEDYVQTLAKKSEVIHFQIDLEGLEHPIVIERAIFILPLSEKKAEVFIYPEQLGIEVAEGLAIDFTPIAEYLKKLSMPNEIEERNDGELTVRKVEEVNSFPYNEIEEEETINEVEEFYTKSETERNKNKNEDEDFEIF